MLKLNENMRPTPALSNRRFWSVTRHDRNEKGSSQLWGIGRTREEALDDWLIREVDDAQQTFGEHNIGGPDCFDPEALESQISAANDLHTVFYSDETASEHWDDSGYVYSVSWDYAPAWMGDKLVEEWVPAVSPVGEPYWMNVDTNKRV